ncbi:class I SAM-dependent methyltransferase [Patescibacteria group bacterium]|nr:class I SAM-dependent methyltransferase [Patescibacteria group bacterium]
MRQTVRPCPICTSRNNTVLFTQKFVGGLIHNIALCNRCGFVFVNNSPRQTYYAKYYEKMSKYEDTRDFQLHKDCVKIIEQFINKSDRIMDIGCSTGHLLYLLKTDGFKNLSGVDPAPRCKEMAKKKYGITVETNDLFNLKSGTKKYDFLILSAVLEHLDKVTLAIHILGSLINDGGKIFICVPDADNFYRNFEEPFGEFSLEHINFFGKSSLHSLMYEFFPLYVSSDGKAIYSVWQKDGGVRNSMVKYIQLSQSKMDRINRVIDAAPERIIVWGAGSLTERLLSTTNLAQKTIKLADRNTNLQGKKLKGIDIIPPENLENYKEPILVSSFRFKKEILKDIKKLGLKNKIITF